MYVLKKFFVCLVLLALVAGCEREAGTEQAGIKPAPTAVVVAPAITAENYPRLDGSTSAEPILAQIMCEFLDATCGWYSWLDGERRLMPEAGITGAELPILNVSGTHGAYLSLIAGESDLILVARGPSDDELELAGDALVGLDAQPIALDAFVFIVNENNPVEGLSSQELRQIFSGKLTDWEQVGGSPTEIHAYQRDPNSGSRELMEQLVMGDLPLLDAPDMMLPTMFAPFYAVSEDPAGISYSIYFYEENMAPLKERVKLLAVDGVMPQAGSIQTREYPYTTEVYAVTRSDLSKDSLAYRLREWLRSPQGQELIAKSGYVKL